MPADTDRGLLPMTGRGDWASQPLSICLLWGLPIAIGAGVGLLQLPFRVSAGICGILFLWMATGCLLNARRCHRVHCYISGPILLAGALFAGAVAARLVGISTPTFTNVVSGTLVLALLSFVPEMVWRRYA